MYSIDDNGKEILRTPLGRIYVDNEICERVKNKDKIISVGDYSTYLCIKNGIIPKIAVVDFNTQRKVIDKKIKDEILSKYKIRIYMRNKRGKIEENSIKFSVLRKKYQFKNLIVVVDGEEDLISAPLIISLEEGEVLIYGMWDKGGVVMDKENKEKGIKILEKVFPNIKKEVEHYSNSILNFSNGSLSKTPK